MDYKESFTLSEPYITFLITDISVIIIEMFRITLCLLSYFYTTRIDRVQTTDLCQMSVSISYNCVATEIKFNFVLFGNKVGIINLHCSVIHVAIV